MFLSGGVGLVAVCGCVGLESVAWVSGREGVDTLLGPEGTTGWLFALCVAAHAGSAWWLVCVWVRVLFENCIVDASIFVAKFLRAHGGCLGTRNR